MMFCTFIFCLKSAVFNADLSDFGHENTSTKEMQWAKGSVESNFYNNLFIVLTSKDQDTLHRSSKPLIDRICSNNSITCDLPAAGKSSEQQIYDFFFPRRYLLASDELLEQENLHRSSASVIENRLKDYYSPVSKYASFSKQDPLGLFIDFMLKKSANVDFGTMHGYLYRELSDSHQTFVQASFNEDIKKTDLDQLLDYAESQREGIKVSLSSPKLHAHKGLKSGERESMYFGTASGLLIIFILFSYFRDYRKVSSVFLCIGGGLSAGIAAASMIFGSLHIISLLMSVTVAGLLSDYFFHFYVALQSENSFKKALWTIKRPLLLSAITTITGLMVFAFTPVPILQQFSVVSSVSLLTVIAWIFTKSQSMNLPKNYKPSPTFLTAIHSLHNLYSSLKIGIMPLYIIGILAFWFLARNQEIYFDDSVENYQKLDSKLKQSDDTIKRFLDISERQHTYIIGAESFQSLLEKNEEIIRKAQEIAPLNNIKSLTNWVLSKKQQEKSITNYLAIKSTENELRNRIGLPRANPSRSTENSLKEQTYTIEDINHIPALKQVRNLYIGNFDGWHFSLLHSEQKLPANITDLYQHLQPLSKKNELTHFFTELRTGVLIFLKISVVVIFVGLCFFIGFKESISVIIPNISALLLAGFFCYTTLGSLNLFSLLGLILVFFMGLDYGFFTSRSIISKGLPTNNAKKTDQKTMVSSFPKQLNSNSLTAIVLSSLTTFVSFGMLSFSETYAIRSFGVSVSIGIFLVFIFSLIQWDFSKKWMDI